MNPIPTNLSSGLQTDIDPTIENPQVTYVLNGRVETGASGDGFWSNEPSNELALVFPVGKHVVHTLMVPELNRTLFFLSGDVSEIGFAYHNLEAETYSNEGYVIDGHTASTPIPYRRDPVGTYVTLLQASCLAFVYGQELSVEYQFTGTDFYLYIADGTNPDRIIRFTLDSAKNLLLHTDSKRITGYDSCNAPIYANQLDCTRCRLDPLQDSLALSVLSTQTGGQWEAGGLQFRAAYCTNTGERLTEFTALTPLVSIWENALQTRSGEKTSQSVTLSLSSNSTRYTHILIGVLQVIRSQVQTYQLDPYPLSSTTIVLRGNEPRYSIALSELLEARTHYEHSKGLTLTEDRLLRFGLTEKAVPNLQRFLLNIPIRWQTIQVPEGMYANGAFSARYRSFMRDEVIALGIIFEYDDGDETGVFHLPGRSAAAQDIALVNNTDTDSLKVMDSTLGLVPTWKVYNTASKTETPMTPYQSLDNPGSWEIGTMGYYESTERYANRPDVWGSLCNTPIRHHRLPSSELTHIHDGYSAGGVLPSVAAKTGYIYPLGIRVDADAIRTAVQTAESQSVVPAGRITSWRIVRADRTGQASILARGLLYNVPQYNRKGKQIAYPNYPFNDLRADPYLTADVNTYVNSDLPAPKLAFTKTNAYTFHSPDTHFTPVGKGDYLQLETEEYGLCEGQFTEALGQAREKLPTSVSSLLSLQLALSENTSSIFSSPPDPLLLLLRALGESQTYMTLFRAAIPWKNYGVQWFGVGFYNQYRDAPIKGFRIRPISTQATLEPDIQQVGSITVNNRFRERSTFIQLTTTDNELPNPSVQDQSRYLLSDSDVQVLDKSVTRPISAFYGTIKSYQPAQYGRIASIQYLETGGVSCPLTQTGWTTIFGGDTFINRFSLKRKHSFFSTTTYGLADGTSFNYSQYPNVAYPIYFFNTEHGALGDGATAINDVIHATVDGIIGKLASRFDMDRSKFLYYDGVIYLYSYGIPYFFCESAVNVDLRQADDLSEGGFYPVVSPQTWTQENTVSITRDNTYIYDRSYSHPLRENRLLTYPDSQLYNQYGDQYHPNRVIWSEKQNWRYYKALNSFDFDRKHGDLVGLNGLDGGRVLARFEDGTALFNAYTELKLDQEVSQIGNGGMFALRPQWFAQADGGLLGSQHRTFLQTPFGSVWFDAKRGGIYLLPPGSSPVPLHQGEVETFLRKHLTSQLRHAFPTYPNEKNPIRAVYDPTTHRFIFTRHDKYPKKAGLVYNAVLDEFRYNGQVVSINDATYFGDNSFTMGYHLPSKKWSFYSFKSTRLFPWSNGFMSLVNTAVSGLSSSAWVHRNSRLQYQRFFGKLEPFELTIWTGNLPQLMYLSDLQYASEVRRYHQADAYTVLTGITYDQLVAYTNLQTSGVIDLTVADQSDMRTLLYGGTRLVQQNGGSWAINGILDKTQPNNTLPLWINDPSGVRKWVNEQALDKTHSPYYTSRVSGTGFWFHFRQYTQDAYQFIHRWIKPDLQP